MAGILAGDPASPILWILFIADLLISPHQDDVVLARKAINLLLIADDVATRAAQFWSVVGSVVLWVITGRALHHLCETTDVSSCLLGLAWKFDQWILMTCTT